MTKQICLISLICLIWAGPPVFAADATPSAKAQDLLNRVATKVAQLAQQLQKAYVGEIKTLGDTSIVLTTDLGEKAIHTSDATSFFRIRGGSRTEINFAALKIGDDIAAMGNIDPATSDLTARQIIAKTARQNIVSTIKSVDKTILTLDNNTQVDLDGATSLKMITNDKITSAKQADFKIGNAIFVIGYSPDEKTGVYSILKAFTVLP